jgi:hypothetical protein
MMIVMSFTIAQDSRENNFKRASCKIKSGAAPPAEGQARSVRRAMKHKSNKTHVFA